MSLLDKIDILITPNAYKKGKLFAALPSPTFGGELAVDGDFADGSTAWTLNPGWSIGGNSARYDGNALGTSIAQNISGVTGGNRYTVTFEVTQNTGDQNNTISLGSTTLTNSTHLPLGCNTFTGVAGFGTALNIYGNSGELLIIRNLTVKQELTGIADLDFTRASAATRVDENGLVNYAEVIGGEEVTDGNFPLPNTNWILGGGNPPTIGTNDVAINSVDNNSYIQQSGILTSGKYYKITYDVISASATSNVLKLASSFGLGSIPTSVGTQIVYGTAVTSTLYIERYTNGVNATITNVSVKEVTRDNVPRIDYTGGGCPHILAEPQRTNLLKYSEDFSQWAAEESSVSLNTLETLSPDGGNNATILTENTSFGKHGVVVNTTSGGSSYSFSFFAKYKTRQFISIVTSDDVYWQSQVVVNLIDGSITKEFSRSYTITNKVEDFGNGWYKISASINGTYNTRFYSRIYLSNVAVPSDPPNNFYTGESLSAYIWAAQLEVGSYPTSYIPTSGSTVTRNQDIFTRDGIGSLINDSEGVLFAEISRTEDESNYRLLGLDNGTSQNYIKIGFGNNNGNFWILAVVNGVTVINSTNAVSNNANQFYKIAVRYKSGDSVIYIDGVPVLTSSTTFSSGTFTDLDFTHFTGSSHFFGKVKQLQVYNTALTDEQLTSLTS